MGDLQCLVYFLGVIFWSQLCIQQLALLFCIISSFSVPSRIQGSLQLKKRKISSLPFAPVVNLRQYVSEPQFPYLQMEMKQNPFMWLWGLDEVLLHAQHCVNHRKEAQCIVSSHQIFTTVVDRIGEMHWEKRFRDNVINRVEINEYLLIYVKLNLTQLSKGG